MKQNPETWVGIFLLTGIALLCGLIIFFGDLQNYFNNSYRLHVEFKNASGLLKGSDVFLSGATIGKVISDPQPIPGKQMVVVDVRIDSGLKIRHEDHFVIGSSGLMGDRFVDVQPKEYPNSMAEGEKPAYIKDGETVPGEAITGLDDITKQAGPLLESANEIAGQIKQLVTKLNNNVLTDQSTADIKDTFATLKLTAKHADELMTNANNLMDQTKAGKGLLGRLLNDKQLADNFSNFVDNLNEHGPLFYSNDKKDEKKDKEKKDKK